MRVHGISLLLSHSLHLVNGDHIRAYIVTYGFMFSLGNNVSCTPTHARISIKRERERVNLYRQSVSIYVHCSVIMMVIFVRLFRCFRHLIVVVIWYLIVDFITVPSNLHQQSILKVVLVSLLLLVRIKMGSEMEFCPVNVIY